MNKANIRDLIAATGLVISFKLDSSSWFFIPDNIEIRWMTSKTIVCTSARLHQALCNISNSSLNLNWSYSIHVPGWLQKWLNLITAPGSVSNEPGSVTWLATKYLKNVSWRNHTEKLTTWWICQVHLGFGLSASAQVPDKPALAWVACPGILHRS